MPPLRRGQSSQPGVTGIVNKTNKNLDRDTTGRAFSALPGRSWVTTAAPHERGASFPQMSGHTPPVPANHATHKAANPRSVTDQFNTLGKKIKKFASPVQHTPSPWRGTPTIPRTAEMWSSSAIARSLVATKNQW